jgi:hypothetical protein
MLGLDRNLAFALRRCFGGNVPEEPPPATTSAIIALHPSARPEQIARWNAWHDKPVAKTRATAIGTLRAGNAQGGARQDAAHGFEKEVE